LAVNAIPDGVDGACVSGAGAGAGAGAGVGAGAVGAEAQTAVAELSVRRFETLPAAS
jgi:hypothetical protein